MLLIYVTSFWAHLCRTAKSCNPQCHMSVIFWGVWKRFLHALVLLLHQSLVLPQYLTGKTHSQVIFHLTFRQTLFAQLLPCKGHFVSPVTAIFILCTASAADKCFGDQSAKTARTAWDASAAWVYTRAEECFFNHPDPGTQPWLDLCCCLTC